MSKWPRNPTIYEINTAVWLSRLSQENGTSLNLERVPAREWDAIAEFGFDAVWLMGVWERSPAGIAIANRNQGLLEEFRRALPDFRLADNVGSPYCVRRYVVDSQLGGPRGLEIARKELAKRGMRLVLDFVPNHVAPDHPWVTRAPRVLHSGQRGRCPKRSLVVSSSRRVGHCRWTRPLLSRLAGCAATECFRAGTPSGRSGHGCGHRRPVRWNSLRHGDATA